MRYWEEMIVIPLLKHILFLIILHDGLLVKMISIQWNIGINFYK